MGWKMGRCVALDGNGARCKKSATTREHYHGDSEIYTYDSPQPHWVSVIFCDEHKAPPKRPKATP